MAQNLRARLFDRSCKSKLEITFSNRLRQNRYYARCANSRAWPGDMLRRRAADDNHPMIQVLRDKLAQKLQTMSARHVHIQRDHVWHILSQSLFQQGRRSEAYALGNLLNEGCKVR